MGVVALGTGGRMVCVGLVVLVVGAGVVRGEGDWGVVEGFVVERAAVGGVVRHPMFAALDDAGRLYVAESSGGDLYAELREQVRRCRIVVLEDRTGDGVYDEAWTFAEGLAFPMGLVWHEGRLYVADPPDVVVLEDTTGDGRADRRDVLLSGFGHQTNGSLHGLTVGPDGWLYMTVGWPDAYRLRRADGSWLEGRTGAILRCRLDGSDPQVIACGLENPIELAWLDSGELLATNNWHQEPRDGVRDALLHIVEGGVYPRHAHREQVMPLPVTGPWLPAVALRPAVAHSGMVRYEAAAFPRRQRGLFVAEFNTRRIVRYGLQRRAASFRADVETFLTSDDPDFRPSDVLEADDGSLLVVDTGAWYVEHCPTGDIRASDAPGGIWRVRYDEAPVEDPRGEAIPWDELSPGELAALLADARPAVRRRAARELERGGDAPEVEALAERLADESAPGAAMRAAWVLGRMEDAAAGAALRAAVREADGDVAAAAARALGGRADAGAAVELERLLGDERAHVRLAAAEALSRVVAERAVPALLDALAAPDVDRMLEHALAYALFRSADTAALREALEHEHGRVQSAALYLLADPRHDALGPAEVAARASADDAAVREATRRILRGRPEWADQAAGLMRRWARAGAAEDEPELLVDYALAFAFHPPAAEIVADVVAGADASLPLRRALVEAMAGYEGEAPGPWREALGRVLVTEPELRGAAVAAAAGLGLVELDEHLAASVEDEQEEPRIRTRALAALADRRPDLLAGHTGLLLERLEAERGVERMRIARLLAGAPLGRRELGRLAAVAAADTAIDPLLVLGAAERSNEPPPAGLLRYLAARVDAGWAAEPQRVAALARGAAEADVQAAEQLLRSADRAAEGRQALWERYETLLAGGDAALGRELFFGRAACAACHRAEGAGGTGGPDLSSIGAIRSGRDILQSLLFPSSTTAQGYEAWVVQRADGRSHVGMLDRQTHDAMVLRDVTGEAMRVPLAEVETAEPLGRSLMPEGLLGALSDEQVRNLLAYLRSLE